MKKILIICLLISIFTFSCSQIRESAGVNRKNIDEFKVIENPPLVIPPNFNLLPPEQLSEKNINSIESDLAKEILFGLEDNDSKSNVELSTMENILNQTEASSFDDSIRVEIDENFASEKEINSKKWNNDEEINNSILESEIKRNKLLNNNDSSKEIPKEKNKKKKRFFFF